MGKRTFDASDIDCFAAKVPKKTERTHDENQERAYIAASRRADRSLEARLQSAQMASNCHRKRTGKGFKITPEIVMREEMYEEEEDDLPRQYRLAAMGMTANSTMMGDRASAYLSSQLALAQLQRQADINRMFAEAFPHAPRASQQYSQPMYTQPFQGPSSPAHHYSHPQHPFASSAPATTYHRERTQSTAQLTQAAPASPLGDYMPPSRHASFDGDLSTPALTPGSARTDTPVTATPPQHPPEDGQYKHSAGIPIDPSLGMSHLSSLPPSSFTSELSKNAKSMLSFGLDSDPVADLLLNGETGELVSSPYNGFPYGMTGQDSFQDSPFADLVGGIPNASETPGAVKIEQPDYPGAFHPSFHPQLSFGTEAPQNDRMGTPGNIGTPGTPGASQEDGWAMWINHDDDYVSAEAGNL